VEEGKAAKRHKRLKNKPNTTKPHSPTRAENLVQREDGLNVTIRKDHKGHKDSLSWPELAPGAYASEPLDIMSEVDGLVGAETFATVDPHNNNKLARDLAKLAARSE
jgi:hypothetical protein